MNGNPLIHSNASVSGHFISDEICLRSCVCFPALAPLTMSGKLFLFIYPADAKTFPIHADRAGECVGVSGPPAAAFNANGHDGYRGALWDVCLLLQGVLSLQGFLEEIFLRPWHSDVCCPRFLADPVISNMSSSDYPYYFGPLWQDVAVKVSHATHLFVHVIAFSVRLSKRCRHKQIPL